jgi:drug/metabolite transporter (DMT)-like permease
MTCNYVTISLAISTGTNPAALTSLYSLQTIFTAVLFYFLFGEKLQTGHYLGMLCFVSSVLFIAFASSPSPEGLQ